MSSELTTLGQDLKKLADSREREQQKPNRRKLPISKLGSMSWSSKVLTLRRRLHLYVAISLILRSEKRILHDRKPSTRNAGISTPV